MDEDARQRPNRDDAHADSAHAVAADEVLTSLRVDPETGLSSDEAADRQQRHG
ncbi:MAG: cation-transporting P-type ATPase, partial [Actinomycetota bacterium]